jgi:hypothetical protein
VCNLLVDKDGGNGCGGELLAEFVLSINVRIKSSNFLY